MHSGGDRVAMKVQGERRALTTASLAAPAEHCRTLRLLPTTGLPVITESPQLLSLTAQQPTQRQECT